MSEYTIEELMLKVAEGESLAGSDLEGLIFFENDLVDINFSGSNLRNVTLSFVNLTDRTSVV